MQRITITLDDQLTEEFESFGKSAVTQTVRRRCAISSANGSMQNA